MSHLFVQNRYCCIQPLTLEKAKQKMRPESLGYGFDDISFCGVTEAIPVTLSGLHLYCCLSLFEGLPVKHFPWAFGKKNMEN